MTDHAAISGILDDIARAAAVTREALPAGFEESLGERFAAIASDPRALEAELDAPGAASGPGPPDASSRRDQAARLARRAVRRGRRLAGPRLRALERSSFERLGRAAEGVATRGEVLADKSRRLAQSRPSLWTRLAPSARTLAPSRSEPTAGDAPDEALVAWALARLDGAGGLIAHIECGDGWLLGRLGAPGRNVVGVDPGALRVGAPPAGANVVRAGALEWLGTKRPGSLGGIVLSGVTERLRPGSARAICQLVASRLEPGGVVVVTSSLPEALVEADPLTTDLRPGRPVHPVTWCHLLARYGIEELSVLDPEAERGRGRYGVAGRRAGPRPRSRIVAGSRPAAT